MRHHSLASTTSVRLRGTALSALLAVAVTWTALARASDAPVAQSDADFWNMTYELSEPDGAFLSDNLVSNEQSFLQVVPQLRASVQPGGAYLGVGPEQNFTYIATTRPAVAFIVDIRRGNLLLHLLYKALFELSADRVELVSRLFSRPRPADLPSKPSAAAIFDAVQHKAPLDARATVEGQDDILRTLIVGHRFPLSPADVEAIRTMLVTFRQQGPSIDYATTTMGQPSGETSYAALMAQTDARGQETSYLASDELFGTVKDLERHNLIVPVTGDFAGTHAIRAIGRFLRERGLVVSMFYLSNVEDYLGRPDAPRSGTWQTFCHNVATLPVDRGSVFVRPFGLAVQRPDGGVLVFRDMAIGASVRDRSDVMALDALPSALTPVVDDIKACR
jgi:hypothetical protein